MTRGVQTHRMMTLAKTDENKFQFQALRRGLVQLPHREGFGFGVLVSSQP